MRFLALLCLVTGCAPASAADSWRKVDEQFWFRDDSANATRCYVVSPGRSDGAVSCVPLRREPAP